MNELFETLEKLEVHLNNSRYLCGDMLTLADICLFTTLIRFDLVYNGLFKCSKKKLLEYQNLHGYMLDIYQVLPSYWVTWLENLRNVLFLPLKNEKLFIGPVLIEYMFFFLIYLPPTPLFSHLLVTITTSNSS